jgi:hypothetical protein
MVTPNAQKPPVTIKASRLYCTSSFVDCEGRQSSVVTTGTYDTKPELPQNLTRLTFVTCLILCNSTYVQRFFLLQYRTVRMIPGTGTVQVPYHQKVLVLYSTVQVQYAPGIIRSYCTVTGIRRSVQTAPGRVSKRETHRTLNSDG